MAAGLICGTVSAQTAVKFKLNHKLAVEDFAMNQASENDIGDQFNVTRLQYYISGISIVHDGGQIADASDVYILVDAGIDDVYDLGDHDITNVEAINFAIGVDPDVNNQDPAQWPNDHALAPKSPSMHWGWAAGYRFVAMEGYAGSSLSTNYQLHGLGNDHYLMINIPTSAADDNGALLIEINANYTEALKGIQVSTGVIVHGDYGEAATMLKNFNSYVFTSLDGIGNTLSVNEEFEEIVFSISPNPTSSLVNFVIDDNKFVNCTLNVTDIAGRTIVSDVDLSSIGNQMSLSSPGVYFATLINEDGIKSTQKIIVQ